MDAQKWSTAAPESSENSAVFKICVQPNVIGSGHGSQPTFQALSAMAAGSMPSYLIPPVSLPSVADADSDDDNDNVVPVISNRKTMDVAVNELD